MGGESKGRGKRPSTEVSGGSSGGSGILPRAKGKRRVKSEYMSSGCMHAERRKGRERLHERGYLKNEKPRSVSCETELHSDTSAQIEKTGSVKATACGVQLRNQHVDAKTPLSAQHRGCERWSAKLQYLRSGPRHSMNDIKS